MFTKIRISTLAVFAAMGLAAQPSLANDELFKISQDPNQWAMNGRGYDNQRFSPLN